jgi:hypothetical protein
MVKIYSLIHRFCGKTQGDLLRKEVFQYILLLIWQLTDFNLRVRLHLHSNFTVQRILFALFFMHIWKARKKRIKELFVNFCIDRKKNPEIKWLGKDSLITQKKTWIRAKHFSFAMKNCLTKHTTSTKSRPKYRNLETYGLFYICPMSKREERKLGQGRKGRKPQKPGL